MDWRLILSFLGGLTFTLALAVGVARPWRGLVLLWAAGVIAGASGLVPGLTAPYVALATVLGAAALVTAEGGGRCWRRGHREAVRAGEETLAGVFTALLLAGFFLGPLWGLALAGVSGGLGIAYLARRHFLLPTLAALLMPGLRLVALLLPAALLGGRLLGLF